MLAIKIFYLATNQLPNIANPKEFSNIINGYILPPFNEYQRIIEPYNVPPNCQFIFYALDFLAMAGRRYQPEIFKHTNLGQFRALFFKHHDLFKIKKKDSE